MAEALDDREGVGEGGVAEDAVVGSGLEALEGALGEGEPDLDAAVLGLADQDQLAVLAPGFEGDEVVERVDAGVGAVERLEAAVEAAVEAAKGAHCRVSEPSRPSTMPAASSLRASRSSP